MMRERKILAKLSEFSEAAIQMFFLGKGSLKICSKFIGEHRCRSVISVKL